MEYSGGFRNVPVVAGPGNRQRYTWSAQFAAGATQNLLRFRGDPKQDIDLYYSLSNDSTETVTFVATQTANDVTLPMFIDCGPFGGGSIRLGGGVDLSVVVDNLVGGLATVNIWVNPGALIQHVPPISRSITSLAQGVPTFVSPDAGSTGWCPPQRPKLTFISTNSCDLEFIDAAGNNVGRVTYNPGVANREVELIHPPKTRLRVNNTSGVNVGLTATWHRSA